MKGNVLDWLVLASCGILFGLVVYRLANPTLTDEEKNTLSYAQISISFFASIYMLFFMLMLAMGMLAMGISSNLLTFTWVIFCIVTSPIILTTSQYVFQDRLGNTTYLSIGILISTMYSALLPLRAIAPSLFQKKGIFRMFI